MTHHPSYYAYVRILDPVMLTKDVCILFSKSDASYTMGLVFSAHQVQPITHKKRLFERSRNAKSVNLSNDSVNHYFISASVNVPASAVEYVGDELKIVAVLKP